jgi:hypothetical protein
VPGWTLGNARVALNATRYAASFGCAKPNCRFACSRWIASPLFSVSATNPQRLTPRRAVRFGRHGPGQCGAGGFG